MKLFDRDHIDEGASFGQFVSDEVKEGNITSENLFGSLMHTFGRIVNCILSSIGTLCFICAMTGKNNS
jgi:hypothetical protein